MFYMYFKGDGMVNTKSAFSSDSKDTAKVAIEGLEGEARNAPLSTPVHQLRSDYLWVTDLVQQNWCEQQMVYKLTLPTVAVEEPAMTEGSNLHLARGNNRIF